MELAEIASRYKTRWFMLLQVTAALLCGYFTVYSITDGDIFWHLAAGREMISRKAFLYRDPFSYTTPGARWIDVHWLFQVMVYLAERVGGGLRSLLVMKMVVVSGSVLLLFSTFRKNSATLFVWLVTIAVFYQQRYLIPMRPVVTTLLFIGAEIALIERYRLSGKRRLLVMIGVIQLLWVNTQGLFPLGLVIAAAYGVGEAVDRYFRKWRFHGESNSPEPEPCGYRNLLLLPVLLLPVSLCNPYGWRILPFAFGLFVRLNPAATNVYSKTIVENMPLPAMVGTPYMHFVIAVAVLVLLFLFSIAYCPKSVRSAHCLLAAAGLLLAWMAQRNGILLTVFVLPGLLRNFGAAFTGEQKKSVVAGGTAAILLVATGAVMATVNHTRMLASWPHAVSPFSFPVETAVLLERESPDGNLFNVDRYGGYLLWKLYPGVKVSSDTRLTMRSPEFYREYLDLAEHPERFDAYAEKWGITQVVLPLAPLAMYLPLASVLYRSPRWYQIFTDGAEVLFSTDTSAGATVDLQHPATADTLLERLRGKYFRSPAVLEEATVWLGRWYLAAGAPEGARRILRKCGSSRGKLLLAAVEEQTGEYADAEATLRSVCEKTPGNSEARLALAMLYLRRENKEEGIHQLGILLKKDPFNKHARNVLYSLSGNKKEKK
ncbi:MAG: tetratricopeptide repeat protein [Chitinispirillaceae bacterium]|nr:tetratricopeptide repeat protein [Chitinispirillaceae bacterium]